MTTFNEQSLNTGKITAVDAEGDRINFEATHIIHSDGTTTIQQELKCNGILTNDYAWFSDLNETLHQAGFRSIETSKTMDEISQIAEKQGIGFAYGQDTEIKAYQSSSRNYYGFLGDSDMFDIECPTTPMVQWNFSKSLS